jgi:hypothetical protein
MNEVSLSWLPEQSFKDTLIAPPRNPGQVPNRTQPNSTEPNRTQLNSTQLSPLLFVRLIGGDSPFSKMSPGRAERLKKPDIDRNMLHDAAALYSVPWPSRVRFGDDDECCHKTKNPHNKIIITMFLSPHIIHPEGSFFLTVCNENGTQKK